MSKKILMFVLIGVIISMVFIGGAVYFLFLRTPKEAVAEEVKKYEFNIGSFSTNLSNQRSFFKGEIVIETSDEKLLEKMTLKNTQLRDQIIKTLIGKAPEEILSPEGQLKLKNELRQAVSRVLESDKITNIYFIDYIVQ